MARPSPYSPEVRERAVRLVRKQADPYPSQWAAICSIAEPQRLKALEREVRELRQANEILAQGIGVFCPGGARPPQDVMVAFIDAASSGPRSRSRS